MNHSPSFHIDPIRARRAFERVAAQYDDSAVLQREVAQRMDERLTGIRHQPELILDVGSGTGYGAALLRIRYPQATVCELDLAEGMLRVSRERQRRSAPWHTRLLPRKQPWQICADMGRMPLADASSHRVNAGAANAPAQSLRFALWAMLSTPARVFTPVAIALMVPAESGVCESVL